MVRGLDTFIRHFKGFEDAYVIIGGTACDMSMESFGVAFRATKDLDIVLCMEAVSDGFIPRLWDFIRQGGYEHRQKNAGDKQFYRFYKPADATYPHMLELFSRKPEVFAAVDTGQLVPIPAGDDGSSLSAILLDDEYYLFIQAGKRAVEGLSIIAPEYNIPLKAKAWLDLSARKDVGENIDSRKIKKHKNDVYRLNLVISPGAVPILPGRIAADMTVFLDKAGTDIVDLTAFGYEKGHTVDTVLNTLREMYMG